METANFILSFISTIAAVVSMLIALSAKRDIKKLKQHINGIGNNLGTQKAKVDNRGLNVGIISGVNSGDIWKR